MIIKAGKTETAARELTVMMSAVSPPRCIHAAKPEKTKKSYPSVTAEETKKIALPEVSRVRIPAMVNSQIGHREREHR
jgi:hypothetical protein